MPPASNPNPALTIATVDGQRFEGCVIKKMDAESISFEHAAGVATVALAKLLPDLQKRFNYDPQQREAAKAAKRSEEKTAMLANEVTLNANTEFSRD